LTWDCSENREQTARRPKLVTLSLSLLSDPGNDIGHPSIIIDYTSPAAWIAITALRISLVFTADVKIAEACPTHFILLSSI
jgi:hypothetical protein